MIAAFTTNAQVRTSSKPYLFAKVSEKSPAATSELDKAFTTAEGEIFQMKLNNFIFEGIITSSIKKYDNLHSVIIKSTSLKNTVFALSKRINDDKSITYVGRIINDRYADGFELVKETDGRYIMKKIKTDFILQDQ